MGQSSNVDATESYVQQGNQITITTCNSLCHIIVENYLEMHGIFSFLPSHVLFSKDFI